MYNRLLIERINKLKESNKVLKVENINEDIKSSASKIVYAYMDNKLIGEYDSITKCGIALGLTRLMVRKAIDNNVELESGLKLSLTKNN